MPAKAALPHQTAILAQRLAAGSIAVALVVLSLKTTAYLISGSVALYSDALESIVNLIAAAAAFAAIRYASQPADRDHNFGHHKAEYLSAVFEGVLVVIAALMILREAWQALTGSPAPIEQPLAGLAVNMVATAINAIWASVLFRQGRRLSSPALVADARHIMSDVITSLGVVVALGGLILTGWTILDPLLGIIVALNILWQGWIVITGSLGGLMDRAPDEAELSGIEQRIRGAMGGAIEFHDLKARVAGQAMFVDMHLVVPSAMTVEASHHICDRIEEAIRTVHPGAVIQIHVEPEHKAKHAAHAAP